MLPSNDPVLMLRRREIIPVYCVQEVLDLSGGEVKAVEALLRFSNYNGDVVHFTAVTDELDQLELSDETQLIFQSAQKDIACKLFTYGYKYVGFNISPKHLLNNQWLSGAKTLCEYVRLKFPDRGIVYEITEALTSDKLDGTALLQSIETLRFHGAQFAIDDFGKLGSSILRLCLLELEYVKFDRSLVIAALENTFAQNLIRSIVAECQRNYITVIAEGVETQEQSDAWISMNVTLQQGFLFGRPRILRSQSINF